MGGVAPLHSVRTNLIHYCCSSYHNAASLVASVADDIRSQWHVVGTFRRNTDRNGVAYSVLERLWMNLTIVHVKYLR
jgi:hypothetical protein